MLYHPSHLAKPVLTHIEYVGNDHFVVACSTTDRMIPFGQAQRVLKVKLSLDDIEREIQGPDLDAAERLLWRRWRDDENMRNYRKSRVQAPCCGRYRFRYQLEHDGEGNYYCDSRWGAAPACPPVHGEDAHNAQAPARGPSPTGGDAAAGKPALLPRDDGHRDAGQPAKKAPEHEPRHSGLLEPVQRVRIRDF